MKRYNLVICGGTFDLLHKGHKTFIKQILDASKKTILGLTSDSYIQSFKNNYKIESFSNRKKSLEDFLDSIDAKKRVLILSIDDIYGPLLTDLYNPEAIAVTPETESSAKEINGKRKEKSLKEFEVIVFPLDLAEDGQAISSTRIRNGEINRDGRLYISQKWRNKNLILPENMRFAFQKPLGEVINSIPSSTDGAKAITIGDITTQKFNLDNVNQFLSIIDFLVQRKKVFNRIADLGFDDEQEVIKIKNPPSSITPELLDAIRSAFRSTKNRNVILVEGEEDLAVLAALLVSPLGYSIFYGQPNIGIVRVNITEEIKEEGYSLAEGLNIA